MWLRHGLAGEGRLRASALGRKERSGSCAVCGNGPLVSKCSLCPAPVHPPEGCFSATVINVEESPRRERLQGSLVRRASRYLLVGGKHAGGLASSHAPTRRPFLGRCRSLSRAWTTRCAACDRPRSSSFLPEQQQSRRTSATSSAEDGVAGGCHSPATSHRAVADYMDALYDQQKPRGDASCLLRALAVSTAAAPAHSRERSLCATILHTGDDEVDVQMPPLPPKPRQPARVPASRSGRVQKLCARRTAPRQAVEALTQASSLHSSRIDCVLGFFGSRHRSHAWASCCDPCGARICHRVREPRRVGALRESGLPDGVVRRGHACRFDRNGSSASHSMHTDTTCPCCSDTRSSWAPCA
ncbi:hypothetical protein FB567DRAFT_549765 [Paraphoma chrysanthemicola]|uniref:Uncharacterized protein n=1 Tax=Paraphoma chrysanthemicola TaxID=798071 RepID=A0A8K0R3J6_9PLEO|nr:hypothetical protein FB567DRAFT_549765 [Paraphoma chrysanthemicola]